MKHTELGVDVLQLFHEFVHQHHFLTMLMLMVFAVIMIEVLAAVILHQVKKDM